MLGSPAGQAQPAAPPGGRPPPTTMDSHPANRSEAKCPRDQRKRGQGPLACNAAGYPATYRSCIGVTAAEGARPSRSVTDADSATRDQLAGLGCPGRRASGARAGCVALLPAERAVLLALLRMLGAADAALREPAGIDPTAHAAGVLIALLDTYHREIVRLGQ